MSAARCHIPGATRLVLCALGIVMITCCAYGSATVTPLGLLPGTASSEAIGVSADGSVVAGNGIFYSGPDGFRKAWRWTAGTGMQELGSLPGGMGLSFASAVSADGSTIIGISNAPSTFGLAFRWTSAGGMVSLGDLPGGVVESRANGVSADGSVIVGDSHSAAGYRAFRWTGAGGMVSLSGPPGGVAFSSAATGISSDGSVIAGIFEAGDIQACRWTSGTGLQGLGYLPGTGSTFGYGVSADGSTIVGEAQGPGFQQAFRWTSAGGMVGLGFLPGTNTSSAIAVSGDGSVIVVGPSIQSGGGGETYLWTEAGGMQRLWDVLLANGLDPAADGWTSLSPRNISADGKTIVGGGIRNGVGEAFIAVIPEPTSLGLMLPVAVAALLRRRRGPGRQVNL